MASLNELIARVLADPEDDRPRRELADQLTEIDPRGEFVKLQLDAYDHLRRHGRWPDAGKARMGQLQRSYANLWTTGLGPVDAYEFRRGFIERIKVDAATFLKLADAIFKYHPVRHLQLTGAAAVIDALFASPHLARMRSLDLSKNKIGDHGVEALARSAHLGKLRWLDLSYNGITEKGAEALAASRGLPDLQYVRFEGNGGTMPVPTEGGVDHDGSVLDPEYSPLNRRLVKTYGSKPWLTRVPAHLLDGTPDPDAV
jgi:hypothetical protein